LKKNFTYRPYFAGLLAFLLLFSISLKEIHHLVGHAHESANECHASGNDVHVHDDSYHAHQCLLCHFSFSEINYDLTEFRLKTIEPVVSKISFPDPVNYSPLAYQVPSLRGPPFLLT